MVQHVVIKLPDDAHMSNTGIANALFLYSPSFPLLFPRSSSCFPVSAPRVHSYVPKVHSLCTEGAWPFLVGAELNLQPER